MSSFRDLLAWQKAMDLVDDVYAAVRSFPPSEMFCLGLQLRKSSIAIPSDIAEGRGRHSTADYRHFLREARGSTHEVETQIEIAMRQHFVDHEHGLMLVKRAQEVGRLINGLLRSLE